MKVQKVLMAFVLAIALLVAGCGKDEKKDAASEKEKPKAEQAKDDKKADKPEEDEAKDEDKDGDDEQKEEGKDDAPAGKDEILNPYIAEESGGDVSVVYTNKEPDYAHDQNGFKVTVDEYQIVHVKDVNKGSESDFKGATEGYVVTARVTADNQTGKVKFYHKLMYIQIKDQFDLANGNPTTFIREEDRLLSKAGKTGRMNEVAKFEAGEKVTGFMTFILTEERYKALASVQPKFIIKGNAADDNEGKGGFKGDATFDFIYSDDQKKKLAEQPDFYEDEIVTDYVADKEMIFEKTDIGETEKLRGVNVTLEGVQYTEITPTESTKGKFRNFGDSGIVAITVKFTLDNQSKESISAVDSPSKITLDDYRGWIHSGSFEPREPDEIKPGEKGEKLAVFLMRKDEFGIIKKFELEFGPIKNMNFKDVSKGHTVKFTLPTPKK